MKRINFVTLILGTIGGLFFALGMCMALLPAWNVFRPGIAVGCAGLVVLLAMLLVRRKMAGKSLRIRLTGKAVGAVLLGSLGTAAFGLGLCLVLVWESLLWGIALGMTGILLLLFLIPLVRGLQ